MAATAMTTKMYRLNLWVLGGSAMFTALTWIAGLAFVIASAVDSETAGVNASKIMAGPMGLSLGTFVGAAAAAWKVRTKPALKFVVPAAVGLLFGSASLGATFLFFEVIFPAL